ncbi:hemolysin family protein [uncultured Thermanaerothrix sp.]|uniref:hemolysin family protein n=1 Tax=uncultured Thermanaerothrix sp. TaxID=1195149 RepID=UPI00262AB85A|nr:hemolysin family protein [uncultured Thermanaerothrix sp.]
MDDSNRILEVLVIFLLILLNGFFAMSEMALVSVRKVRLQQQAEEGERGAQTALELTESPNRFLSTIQVGITLIGILAGALGGATLSGDLARWLTQWPALAPYSQALALALVVLATTYFSLVLGELIPKRLALYYPEQIATVVSRPMLALSRLTAPVVSLLSASTEVGLRLLGVHPSKEPEFTEEDIRGLIEQGTQEGIFESSEQRMVEGVFRLGDRTVDAIMTPRTEIEWIDLEESPQEILEQVLRSRHTRFPVAQGDLDSVLGVISARDVLAQSLRGGDFNLSPWIQPPLFVPDSMSVLKVLEALKSAGVSIALVIDEYGGVLGMVTHYDLFKAIVGELGEADESGEPLWVQREDGSWLMDGLLPIDEFKELLDLETLPDEERVGYQTLAGFILSQLGVIPVVGQVLEWDGLRFEVVDMDGRRIDKVLVSRISPSVQGEV